MSVKVSNSSENISILIVPVPDEVDFDLPDSVLSAHERDQVYLQRHKHDRVLRLAAHTLKRLCLATIQQVAPSNLIFASGPFGKPYLLGSDIHFNLSHTRGMVAFAVCYGQPVGIDIQSSDSFSSLIGEPFTASVLTQNEQNGISKSAIPARDLLWIWVSKEAVLKAEGVGFHVSPKSIEIMSCLDISRSCDWELHHFSPSPNHALALAYRITDSSFSPRVQDVSCSEINLKELLRWGQGEFFPESHLLEPTITGLRFATRRGPFQQFG